MLENGAQNGASDSGFDQTPSVEEEVDQPLVKVQEFLRLYYVGEVIFSVCVGDGFA